MAKQINMFIFQISNGLLFHNNVIFYIFFFNKNHGTFEILLEGFTDIEEFFYLQINIFYGHLKSVKYYKKNPRKQTDRS